MYIIIGLVCLITMFCFGYYVYAGNYAGYSSAFLSFWLLIGICFGILAVILFLHKRYKILEYIPKVIRILTIVVGILILLVFGVMESLIISKMNEKPDKEVEYLIILGAKVRGQTVTKSLAKRLDAAYDFMIDNKDVKAVCTGGQGADEKITEALAMKKYLVAKGIEEDRIILEDKSTTTYENLKNAKNIINDNKANVAVVTNNFHVYRGMHLTRAVGFENVQGIAGKSDKILLLNYMVRESLALFKDLILY